MNRSSGQELGNHSDPAGRETLRAPQVTLEFVRGECVLVLRPGERPLRQPIRRDAVALRLLDVLLFDGDTPRDLTNPESAWVPKHELVRLAVSSDVVSRSDSFKKSLRTLRLWLATNQLGEVPASGDGLYRFVAPRGTTITASLRD